MRLYGVIDKVDVLKEIILKNMILYIGMLKVTIGLSMQILFVYHMRERVVIKHQERELL